MILNLLFLKGGPGIEIVCEGLLSDLGLLVRVLPSLSELLDVSIKKFGTVGISHQLFSLGNEVHDHLPLILEAVEDLVLLLNVLLSHLTVATLDLLDRSIPEVINEFKDGNEVISIAVALPVAFCLYESFLDLRDQILVSIDDDFQFFIFFFLLVW